MTDGAKQTVMITGASKGLGKALALAFARQGARLVVCARNEEAIMEVKQEALRSGAADVVAVRADASDHADIDRFVSQAETAFGSIDVLINNAAVLGPSPMPQLLDLSEADLMEVLRVNANGPFLVTKRVLPGMLRRNSGSIIFVSSEAGITGFAGWGAYGISKFAVEGLAQTWADELTSTAVRVNWVDPGNMATDMMNLADPDPDYSLADPAKVVDVFLYLASAEAKEIHGRRLIAQQFVR